VAREKGGVSKNMSHTQLTADVVVVSLPSGLSTLNHATVLAVAVAVAVATLFATRNECAAWTLTHLSVVMMSPPMPPRKLARTLLTAF
jgi:hypothetical protein